MTSMVCPGDRRFFSTSRDHPISIVVEPVTVAQVHIARRAHQRYGRGRGHPARLNFGDCFAYALAKDLDEPLLFIGQDFVHTDIQLALT